MTDRQEHVLDALFQVVKGRKTADPESSYTAKLYAGGTPKIARKVGEESVETVVAALSGNEAEVISESADVLYHLIVLWADLGIDAEAVWSELEKRTGISGIEEKNSRA